MPRYEDRAANRFWEIHRDGAAIHTRWGTIGGIARDHTRVHEDAEAARAQADALVATRLAAGFRAVVPKDPARRAELEAALKTEPVDLATALVYADLLLADDDPMGELIALQCAIAVADGPDAAAPLLSRARALITRHWKYLKDRPGGFPWRAAWRGRDWIKYEPLEPQQLRGPRGPALFERLRTFLDTCTDSVGPSTVRVATLAHARGLAQLSRTGRYDDDDLEPAQIDWLVALHRALGPGVWEDDIWQRTHAFEPEGVHERLSPLLATCPDRRTDIALGWQFRLTWPGTRTRLPYQDAVFYGGYALPLCALRVDLLQRRMTLRLSFPFERPDADFVACYDRIVDTLGPVLSKRWFYRCTPKRDGRGYRESKLRVERALLAPTPTPRRS